MKAGNHTLAQTVLVLFEMKTRDTGEDCANKDTWEHSGQWEALYMLTQTK